MKTMKQKKMISICVTVIFCLCMMMSAVSAAVSETVAVQTGDDLKTPVIAVVACVLSVGCIIFLIKSRRPRG